MPPIATNQKEARRNIKKTRLRNHLSSIITTKTTNIKKGIKTDSQLKTIPNFSLTNKTCSKWISLNYNQFSSRY
jgi:hypothetical protein